jgi:hypothetical protein
MPQAIVGVLSAIGSIVGGGAITGSFIVAGVAAVGFVVADAVDPDLPSFDTRSRNNNLMVKQSAPSRRLGFGRFRAGGIWFYVETTGSSNEFLHLVLGFCEGPIQEFESVWFGDQQLTLVYKDTGTDGIDRYWLDEDDQFADNDGDQENAMFRFHLGATDQVADSQLISESANWTTNHKLLGIAYIYVKLKYSQSAYGGRLPEISAVIKGSNTIKDSTDSDNEKYTNNPALCLNHYLTSPVKGTNADYNTEIEKTALSAAANVCDENISLKAGGTEKRYTANGLIDLGEDPEAIINQFKEAFAGSMVYTNGKFVIDAGAYEAPTFTITEDMITGSVILKNKQPKRDRINLVKGTFVDESNGWQVTDLPTIKNSSYVTEDGEELLSDIDFKLVKSGATGQRLNKIKLEKSRLDTTLQLKCNLRAFRAQAGKTVRVNLSRYNYSGTIFKVLETSFGIGTDGGVEISLTLRRTASTVYDWNHLIDETLINTPPSIIAPGTKVADVIPSLVGGTFLDSTFPKSVTLSTLTSGATIRYSKSALPNSTGDGLLYSGAISISQNETLYARGFRSGFTSSNALVENYAAKVDSVVPSQYGGSYPNGDFPLSVALSTTTSGATIRYSKTTMPLTDTEGIAYTGAISVSAGETLYAKAFKTGYVDSDGMTETYTAT